MKGERLSRLYDTKQEIRGVISINPGTNSILTVLKTIAISLALIVDMMAERRCE